MAGIQSDVPRKLWKHPNPKSTEMWAFKESLEQEKGLKFPVRLNEPVYRCVLTPIGLRLSLPLDNK